MKILKQTMPFNKKIFLGILLTLSILFQVDSQSLEWKYPFLNLDKNQLDFYGKQDRFQSLFDKLDNIVLNGEGKINVLHMGGSHVQGGVLSHAMRENLQSISPGLQGERGLVFPFALAKTNNPWNYVVKSTGKWEGARVSVNNHYSEWGISGVTATTYNPASTLTLYSRNENHALNYNKVRIFYHQCECSYEPVLSDPSIINSKIDSTNHFLEVTFDMPLDTLYLSLRQTNEEQSQFTLQGLQFLNGDEPAIVYNPIGVNGASTDDFMRSQMFAQQMTLFSPDLVIFGIGINDANTYAIKFSQAQFEYNYDQLVNIIRGIKPDAAIIFMTNNDSYFQKLNANPNAYKVRESMIRLAKKHDAAVWDLFEIMGGLDAIRTWEGYKLASPDRIHFTRDGYLLQASLLSKAIKEAFGDYLANRYSQQP